MIPIEIKETLGRYVKDRIPTGSFLEAVLSNDLFDAVGRADHINREILPEIVSYIYNCLPSNCYGSRKIVKAWLEYEPEDWERKPHIENIDE